MNIAMCAVFRYSLTRKLCLGIFSIYLTPSRACYASPAHGLPSPNSAEERTPLRRGLGKREFIVQTGSSKQTRRNDERRGIVPMGARDRRAVTEFEWLASGKCGADELWGTESGRQSAAKSGTTDARTRESGERGTAHPAVS